MSSEDEREILQKRILDAKKNWQFFLSGVPLREANLSLDNQTLNTEVEISGEINYAEELHACLSAVKPSSTLGPATARQAVVPPRFDAAQLARLVGISSTIACECPNHLAELIVSLNAFERYSGECANRDDKDAQLHAQLGESAGQARSILEESLSRLIEIEGIVI